MKKIQVAIIEDNPSDLQIMVSSLENTGQFQVLRKFMNGSDFLLAMSEELIPIDLVIMDYRMPVLNGLETFRNLHHRNVRFKILLVSHGYYSHVMKEVMSMGTQNYCQKSVPFILKNLHRIMAGRTLYEDIEVLRNWEGQSKELALQIKDELYWRDLLSPLDKKIIQHICNGLNSTQIGKLLGYETSSIEKYRGLILQSLELNNSQQLSSWAFANGLVNSSFLFQFAESAEVQLFKHERIGKVKPYQKLKKKKRK
jgi:DNA-binding NarL/FixJ family response regulator